MFINKRFILASSSKSRKQILKNNNLDFLIKKPTCDESAQKNKMIKKGFSAKKISLELARLKAKSVSVGTKNYLVVGSDTVILFKGKILNKAKNIKEARLKISSLSGKKHQIFSSASA